MHFRRGGKKELNEIGEMINGESSIDNAVGLYNDRVEALFDRGREKGNRPNVKWYESKVK